MVAGSSNGIGLGSTLCTGASDSRPKGARLMWKVMRWGRPIFGRTIARRALAVFACAVLLYFAAGGSLLHHHTSGNETPCHVCQSLHMPLLAAAAFDLVAAPELIARYFSQPQLVSSSNSFSLNRASRAPPSA